MVHISSRFNYGYVEALCIVKKEQPDLWKTFCSHVPTFPVVFLDRLMALPALLTHISFRKLIKRSVKEYTAVWEEHGDSISSYLDRKFGVRGAFDITAYVCVTPLYIRNIEKSFFLLPTNAEESRFLEIMLHELSHFYFYDQCVSENSHEAWRLSELIVPYLVKDYFGNDILKDSYAGKPSASCEHEIKKWINGEQGFKELVKNTIERERKEQEHEL